MGVHIPPLFNSMECSARPEIVSEAFQMVGTLFESVVLIAQPHLLKYLIDFKLIDSSIADRLYILSGGTQLHPNFSSYLSHHLGLTQDTFSHRIVSLFGAAEVGLGIGTGTIQESGGNGIKEIVFRSNSEACFLECIDQKLIVTCLDPYKKIPIIRYATGDFIEPSTKNSAFSFKILGKNNLDKSFLLNSLSNNLFKHPDQFSLLTGAMELSENTLYLQKYPDKLVNTSSLLEIIKKYFPIFEMTQLEIVNQLPKQKTYPLDFQRKMILNG